MKTEEVKALFRSLTSEFFPTASVVFANQSRIAKQNYDLVVITPSNVRRHSKPNYAYEDGRRIAHYASVIPITVDLFTHGREVRDQNGKTVAYSNDAMEKILDFLDFLNSDYVVDWCDRYDVCVQVFEDAQDLTGIINETQFDYRARLNVNFYFVQTVGDRSDRFSDQWFDHASITDQSNTPETSFFAPYGQETSGYYSSMERKKNYLYEANYGLIDYSKAIDHFKKGEGGINFFSCSSLRKGNWFGRNLDWTYNRQATFIIHTPNIGGRYASVCVAGGIEELTDEFVKSGAYSDSYYYLPFRVYDGINERGVVMNMNVVPTDKGINKSIPYGDCRDEISAVMLVRFVLDKFGSANEAADYISNHLSVFFPKALHDMKYELHFLLADAYDTYIVEFADNRPIIIDASEKAYITNFHIHGVTFNDDGTVYTPETQDSEHNAVNTNGVTEFGSGLERYNYIVSRYGENESKEWMRSVLDGLLYTKTYSTSQSPADPFWYTEYVGANGLTCKDPASSYEGAVAYYGQAFSERSRDSGVTTWQTVHSSVYDIENRMLYLKCQEESEEYSFSI